MDRTVFLVGNMRYILAYERKVPIHEVHRAPEFETKGTRTLAKTKHFKILDVVETPDTRLYIMTDNSFVYI